MAQVAKNKSAANLENMVTMNDFAGVAESEQWKAPTGLKKYYYISEGKI